MLLVWQTISSQGRRHPILVRHFRIDILRVEDRKEIPLPSHWDIGSTLSVSAISWTADSVFVWEVLFELGYSSEIIAEDGSITSRFRLRAVSCATRRRQQGGEVLLQMVRCRPSQSSLDVSRVLRNISRHFASHVCLPTEK